MDLIPYLRSMVEQSASDLYLSSNSPAVMKIEGVARPVTRQPLTPGMTRALAYSVLNERQRAEFEREMELDMALGIDNLGRFRINVFQQRGDIALVARHVKSVIPDLPSLGLPSLLNDLVMEQRGLILVVGAAGTGKSSTLAAMIDHRNRHRCGHILTIEDPIEFIHKHQKSVVNQREVGMDTRSFETALRRAMREAPDVIMLGEVRDRDTMQHAVHYAETGHLCLSTLHASNANKALRRIVNFFPESMHREVLQDLSLHLNAIISQRLLPAVDGKRVAAVEILLATAFVRELIGKGDIDTLHDAMEKGNGVGMQTFDQSIFALYRAGRITREVALESADSKTNMGIQIRLQASGETPSGAGLSYDNSR